MVLAVGIVGVLEVVASGTRVIENVTTNTEIIEAALVLEAASQPKPPQAAGRSQAGKGREDTSALRRGMPSERTGSWRAV